MHFSNAFRFLVGVTVAVALAGGATRAEVIEQILVKVNGEIFTKRDLETRQVGALRQMGQQIDPKADLSDTQLRTMLDEVTPQLLVSVIDEMLIVQRGRELGYRMGDDQFQSILESIKKDNKLENEEQFQAALKQENMTLQELRASVERQMIVSRVQQNEVLGKVTVSDEEARVYYDAHRTEFTSPQTITLREIFVSVAGDPATNPTQDALAREKAAAIRERALAGESFEKLAADLSDAPSRANAGLIGPLNVADLSPDIRSLIDPMKAGDVTNVLKANRGYQILKLESLNAAQTTVFEQAQDQIKDRLIADKRQVEFQKYLEKARAQAIIEWKNEDIRKAYEQGIQKVKTPPPAAPAQ